LFIAKNRRLPVVNIVILLTMLGGLLLGGWAQANVSFNFNLEDNAPRRSQTVASQRSFFEFFQ
jgi:hypothetical protein